MKKNEFEIVREFTQKLGLENKTDGTLFIYKAKNGVSTKPDGYYYYEGITFILDAKAEGQKFIGQLEDYMKLETNNNFIGFKYNGIDFECYINGKLQKQELRLQNKDYYKITYFNTKINNEEIVSKSAKKLADLFRDSRIDKQMNVPFIGASILCMKFGKEIDLTSTNTILKTLTIGINALIKDTPLTRKQKKEFIKTALSDSTLENCKSEDLFTIMSEISTIYNFINISSLDNKGHDIMNNFLKVFRKWNSANANEKGEVFTPDHIAQLMYKITKCSKDNTIMDPTCGSGTFLTNAMLNMLKETDNLKEKINIKENQLLGIEINNFNATLAGINMLLHGDGASNIFFDDCFVKLSQLNNCYDRVLMNPPFSLKDRELKFVLATLENMKEGGYLSTIIPKSCVKGTDEKDKEYLEKIFKFNRLISVISLPNDLFMPNAGVSTCILTFQKDNKGHSGDTLLIDCSDDGYVLKNESRIDNGKWEIIEKEIMKCYVNNSNEFRVVKKPLKYSDELLFEKYSSHRSMDVEKSTFERYLRENIASKVLCGKTLNKIKLDCKDYNLYGVGKFKISDLLVKLEKGKTKSLDRKLESKYDLVGIPLIVAKKDNNGIGGMTTDYKKTYQDKFCIIAGGDGGGGKTYYCDFEFAATGFVMVCDLVEQYKSIDKYAKFYLSVVISERLFKTIGHGRTISAVPDIEIELPIKEDGVIDFDYMDNYIKKLPLVEIF